MDACSLYPPNNCSFSDEVIRNVIQRTNPTNMSYIVQDESDPASTFTQSSKYISRASTKMTFRSTADILPSSRKRRKVTPEELLRRKIRRREVCRVNQQRYMNKQRQLLADLEDDICKLQEDIKGLELQHHSVTVGIPTQQTVWSVAAEYFRLFRHGFRSPPEALDAFALKFLMVSMAPDVTNGFECGPQALLRNWKLFSLCFEDVYVQVGRLETGALFDSLIASTTTSITISSNTLRQAFPHLNSDGHGGVRGGAWCPLAVKLLGRHLVVQGSVSFDWDTQTDRVVKVVTLLDLVTPMLRLFGSLEDVSRVFERALITPEGRVYGAEHCFV
ncbi:hypothetical protein L914_13666 [Phytophthora nicotianae]|uniref:BZIP domain-containing protein n=1 Tax=Phytophthora nicotianae TaxID=4792 RepID=W2MVG5_PHYNI|nr:hypothetical protein L914_13666 [Phytophthora nicotianae]